MSRMTIMALGHAAGKAEGGGQSQQAALRGA
jgi:hypothetical protein